MFWERPGEREAALLEEVTDVPQGEAEQVDSISGGGRRRAQCLGVCERGGRYLFQRLLSFPLPLHAVAKARIAWRGSLIVNWCRLSQGDGHLPRFPHTAHCVLCDESLLPFLQYLSRFVALRKCPTLSKPRFPHSVKVEQNRA